MKNEGRLRGPRAGLIIMLLTLVAYSPSLRGGFSWDDDLLITQNRMVKARDGLYRFWFTAEAPDYRPVTWSLWWLEWRCWDGRPLGYHVVNVVLHAVTAVLVWLILRRLNIPGAWLAALVFAVHPVNVATVAWISEQKNTLSMLFYALAIFLYLRFDEEGRWAWYGWSLASFLVALLTKTAVVMLPFVLLGCAWWRHERVRWKDLLCDIPFFLPSLGMGIVTIVQHQRALAGAIVQAGGGAARLATAGWVPWFYLSKALLPVNLMVIYPRWEVDPTRWVSYVPGTLLVGCLVASWWNRKTWGRAVLFGLGYFLVTLFPVLGFFDQSFYYYSWVADHWQYYSIIGIIALVVAAGEKICRTMYQRNRRVDVPVPFGAELVGITALIVLGAATWSRCCIYADNATLWRDNLAKNPSAWVAHNNLGNALRQVGKLSEAVAHFEEALRLNPDYAQAHNNLGAALWQKGESREAVDHYERALQLKPDYAEARNNLAIAQAQLGKYPAAVADFEEALRIQPDNADTHYNLGVTLERLGRVQAAIDHYEQALQIEPRMTIAQNRLARLRAAQ